MHPNHAELFARIRDFEIDEGKPDFTFEARLAREKGWSLLFAQRAIAEYKRFLLLAMTAGHPVTPSVQVDEVWHLHLTFTRSYWQRLCGELLGKPLHHDPTRGGTAESSKFHTQYERTLASYRQAFGMEPPADLWPRAEQRFEEDHPAKKGSVKTHWIVPKDVVKRGLLATIALTAIGFVCGCGLIPGLSISPENALRCFPFVWLGSLLLGYFARERMRSTGNPPRDELAELGWVESAYLVAPGRKSSGTRLLSATLARLVATGAARVEGDWLEATEPRPLGLSPCEVQVLKQLPLRKDDRDRMTALTIGFEFTCDETAQHLRDEGYILGGSKKIGIGLATMFTAIATFVVLYLPILASEAEKDFVLGLLCISIPAVGIPSFVLGFPTMSRWTHRGRRARKQLRRAAWRERRTNPEPSLAVAAFGTTILAGTAFDGLKSWYPQTSSATTSGCGVGCGGGGCGGGCGGCGGGGCGCGG